MANMAQLTRRQSSRELGRQRSYDRMELRELHGRLLSNESQAGHSSNYGALNPAFKEESSSLVSWSIMHHWSTIVFMHTYLFLCLRSFFVVFEVVAFRMVKYLGHEWHHTSLEIMSSGMSRRYLIWINNKYIHQCTYMHNMYMNRTCHVF